MESNQKSYSTRWNYYIDRKFQNQFMARFAIVIVLVALVALGALWILRSEQYGLLPGGLLISTDLAITEQTGTIVPKAYYDAFTLYWPPVLIISAINLILILVFGLFYSHSMAGPIHNIKESLQALIDGAEARPIRIRKGDQFQDLADLINQLIEKRVK
jgi:methyl-accepting chemotaxis protein